MPKVTLFLLSLLLLCLATSSVHARTVYDVEIILFENLDVPADPSERWHPRVVTPNLDNAVAFERAAIRGAEVERPPSGFGRLERSRLNLDRHRDALERSERYRVIAHFGWHQPALDRDEAIALRVTAGEPVRIRLPVPEFPRLEASVPDIGARDRNDDETMDYFESSAVDSDDSDASVTTARELDFYPLDGTVTLVVSRYLHILTDLYLTAPVEWAGGPLDRTPATGSAVQTGQTDPADRRRPGSASVTGGPTAPEIALGPHGMPMLSYPFVQQRRMRSGEVHHLDHPVMSMLIVVTPRRD